MNPYTLLLAFIDQWIKTNGNREITAAVLNPVLKAIAEWGRGEIGDLENLSTSNKSNIVAAINEVNAALQGVGGNSPTVYRGNDEPNITPPPSFQVGDFYIQEDLNNDPMFLYIFDGNSWVNLTAYFQNGSIEPDQFLTTNEILQDVTDFTWQAEETYRLSGEVRTLAADYTTTIATEDVGISRFDLIEADAAGVYHKKVGVAGEEAVIPTVTAGRLMRSVIGVYGSAIVESPPLLGAVMKSAFSYVTVNTPGVVTMFPVMSAGNYRFTAATEVHGFIMPSNGGLFDGQLVGIYNDTSSDILIPHLYSGSVEKFYFGSEEDFVLPPKHNATFAYEAEADRVAFKGSSASVGGDGELSQLQLVTEDEKTGWRLRDVEMENRVPIGKDAVDMTDVPEDWGNPFGASGDLSSTNGAGVLASGYGSRATGEGTVASGDLSRAGGFGSIANGYVSIAEGDASEASGDFSRAGGQRTKATAPASVSEGYWTEATGMHSRAEGSYSKATATAAHAQNDHTLASGENSHSQNYYTIASGQNSSATGEGTEAAGRASTTQGSNNKASTFAETVIGLYAEEIEGTDFDLDENDPVFRVGIGERDQDTWEINRRDGFRMYKNGAAYLTPISLSAVTTPVRGMYAFDDDNDVIVFYDGTNWVAPGSGGLTPEQSQKLATDVTPEQLASAIASFEFVNITENQVGEHPAFNNQHTLNLFLLNHLVGDGTYPPDVTPPTAPQNIVITNITADGYTAQADESTDN